MSTAAPSQTIVYPDRDGLPMSDNTLQFEWIRRQRAARLAEKLRALGADPDSL